MSALLNLQRLNESTTTSRHSVMTLLPGNYEILEVKPVSTINGDKFLMRLDGKDGWFYSPSRFTSSEEVRAIHQAAFDLLQQERLFLHHSGTRKYRNFDYADVEIVPHSQVPDTSE